MKDELMQLLERLRRERPEFYRHIVALIKQILATA